MTDHARSSAARQCSSISPRGTAPSASTPLRDRRRQVAAPFTKSAVALEQPERASPRGDRADRAPCVAQARPRSPSGTSSLFAPGSALSNALPRRVVRSAGASATRLGVGRYRRVSPALA
jgi:hypothetical protein